MLKIIGFWDFREAKIINRIFVSFFENLLKTSAFGVKFVL